MSNTKQRRDPTSGYESVRRELRLRGYLDGPIQRFLLDDLSRARSAPRALIRTAVKAAVVAGPIVAALLAGSAAAAHRPLLGPGDLFLFWLYFTPLATAALFVLDLLVGLVVLALARGREARGGDIVRAWWLVGLPVLLYLLQLWRLRRPVVGPLADLAFLVLAALTALVVAWLAGLVSLAGLAGRTGQIPGRRRRAGLMLLVLLPLGALFFVASGWLAGRGESVDPAPFDVVSAPPLLVIGLDGLDGELLEAFESRGVVDGLLSGLEAGSVYPRQRPEGAEPPEVWTTLMTGVPPAEHGVRSVGAERLPGVETPLNPASDRLPLFGALRLLLPTRTVPTTAEVRRVLGLWEIASLRVSSVGIGWWASWPADAGAGSFVVSDRVLAKLLAGAPGDRDTFPGSLFDRLSGDFEADRAAIRTGFEAAFPSDLDPTLARVLWESCLIDAWSWKIGERLMADPAVRGTFVYLPGLDILRHRLGAGDGSGGMGQLLETQQAVESYLAWLNVLIAPALTRAGELRIVLVADGGRQAPAAAEGFVLLVGQGAAPGCVGPGMDDLDLAPLVLRWMGFPPSREMPGSPPVSCLSGLPQNERIATYGRRRPRVGPSTSDWDEEMLERLRSLGYLN